MTTKRLTNYIRHFLDERFDGGNVEEAEETSSGHPAFEQGCDNYVAFAFVLDLEGRTYYITVEDVTTSG